MASFVFAVLFQPSLFKDSSGGSYFHVLVNSRFLNLVKYRDKARLRPQRKKCSVYKPFPLI